MNDYITQKSRLRCLGKTIEIGNHTHGEKRHKYTNHFQCVVYTVDVIPNKQFDVFPKAAKNSHD
jgi:hypothetical protein